MTLVPGTDLGPYRIEAPIGAGGMGAVYKALDTRLDRTVAIKTVEGRFSERFEREAKTIASLNHPHICTLHDVGENYLVMEYIEGAPVSGPLPLNEVLRLGAQIADALEAAHRKGITHRDLKPGNVLVSKAGAKVIDFGLAKAGPVVRGELDVTMTKALTGEGAIVGTICYMSPEQLQGQEADARSDIFALGCVLYEMLTGKRAFDGKSPVSIMAAILEHEPAPLSQLQPMTPAWLDRLIRRCLCKNPEERWQSARDVAIELRDPPALSAPAVPPAAATSKKWPWIAAVALLSVLLVALLATWHAPVERPSYTLEINPPEGESLNVQSQVSPDGRSIALFLGVLGQTRALAVRDLVTGEVSRLGGAEGIIGQPAWSPDSRSLAFVTGTKLKRISASGGTAQVLADFQTRMIPFLSWGSRDIILFSRTDGLQQIPASGGAPAAVTAGDKATHGAPQFLPDGRHFLYILQGADVSGVFAGSVDSPPDQNRIPVLPGAATVPLYARGPDGDDNLVFLRDGALMVQPFDTSSLKLTGNARLLVAPAFSTGTVLPAASLSRNGVLSYASAAPVVRSRISWLDRSSQSRGNIGSEGAWTGLALSPDGKRLAAGRDGDIWLFDLGLTDLAEAVPVRFTFSGQSRAPVWAPDGTWIVFSRGRAGQGTVFRKAANLLSPEAPLPGLFGFPTDWSAAGLLVEWRGDLIVSREDRVTPFLTTPANEVQGQFSPDGKWIAYTSDETGRQEIWVQSFPATGAKWQVSTGGGIQPRWHPDGKELYYVVNPGGRLMAVPVRIQPAFQPSRPVPLFETALFGSNIGFNYAVARDGRFIINSRVPGSSAALTVNTNWFALLKK